MRRKFLIHITLIAVISGVVLGHYLFGGIAIDILRGDKISQSALKETSNTTTSLSTRLSDVGLNASPALGDIGVSAHLKAVKDGKATSEELFEYANNLELLNRKAKEFGQELPLSFFDVQTAQMTKYGWTPFKIASALVQDENEPYIKLLSRSFRRFLEFKGKEVSGEDNALDTSLDMFELANNYLTEIPDNHRAQHLHGTSNHEQAAILTWQTIVAGSTRKNPITRQPVYTHGFLSRFNVATMYQYHIGEGMNLSKAWGVSGFVDKFVGPASNSNQVEHMSISIMLQAVLEEPLLILNSIELEKQILGQAPADEADADIALNSVISEVFVPLYSEDLNLAVTSLRKALRGE